MIQVLYKIALCTGYTPRFVFSTYNQNLDFEYFEKNFNLRFFFYFKLRHAINNFNLIKYLSEINDLPFKLLKVIKSSSILLLIGILRLVFVKSSNYVEHVSEYGIHWNFLFTIVLVKVRNFEPSLKKFPFIINSEK